MVSTRIWLTNDQARGLYIKYTRGVLRRIKCDNSNPELAHMIMPNYNNQIWSNN